MGKKELLVDPSSYDLNVPLAGIDEIRKYNKQRFEMEQLTAIVYENFDDIACVGYKDITEKEFWVAGHMPGFALMPGVIMCEVAAQLSSYFSTKNRLMDESCTMGFAGLDQVRFRGMVRPGDRLVMQAKLITVRKILITARFIGLVKNEPVCEGVIKGVPLNLTIGH
ncbi:MAG: beta-hydroxyacyl-ACP dehydratase [Planctomycetaceae bacterium]|nr:beta-hydroxyacyl-ACP dehydratase [Planctomycetaceae bacterium]